MDMTTLGATMAPSLSLGLRASESSLAPGGVGTSSTRQEAGTLEKSPRHQTSMSQSRTDGEWIHQIHNDENDSVLHSPVVSQELSWVMLHLWDIEELDS